MGFDFWLRLSFVLITFLICFAFRHERKKKKQ